MGHGVGDGRGGGTGEEEGGGRRPDRARRGSNGAAARRRAGLRAALQGRGQPLRRAARRHRLARPRPGPLRRVPAAAELEEKRRRRRRWGS